MAFSLASATTLLQSIAWGNTAVSPSVGVRTIVFNATDDEDAESADSTLTLDIYNNAPVVDLNGAGGGINASGTFTEGDAYTSYLSSAILTDADSDPLVSLVMTAGGQFGDDGADELIKFDTWTTDSDTDKTENLVVGGTTFRLAFVAATGVLTITNSADESFTAADGQALIRLFEYVNSAEPPTEGDRTFSWVANDGDLNSTAAALTITVIAAGSSLLNLGGTSGNYAGQFAIAGAAAVVSDTAVITGDDPTTLTITLAGFSDGDDETVTIGATAYPAATNDTGSATAGATTFDVAFSAGVFTITKNGGGAMPKADLQTLIDGIETENTGWPFTVGNRTMTFVLDGGTAKVATITHRFAEYPRRYYNPTLPAHYNGTADYTPTTMAELNAALALAGPGDIIELDKDTTYTGGMLIPVTCQGTEGNEIIIRSSGYASLPAFGTRVAESDAAYMATLENVAGSGPADRRILEIPASLDGSGGAKHVFIFGLNFVSTLTTSTNRISRFIYSGFHENPSPDIGEDVPDDIDDFPSHIVFDRCLIHGSEDTYMANCLTPNITYFALTGSRIYEVHDTGANEGIGINPFNTPGPLLIENNYIEVGSIAVLIGDNNPREDDFTAVDPGDWLLGRAFQPADGYITRNHFTVKAEWEAEELWQHKNHIEFKDGIRWLIEGNVFENGWDGRVGVGGQPRSCVYPKSEGLDCQSKDITFIHNLAFNSFYCFRSSAGGNNGAISPTNFSVTDNLFYDMDEVGALANTDNHYFQIERNTCICNSIAGDNPSMLLGTDCNKWLVRDNIFDTPTYQWKGPGLGSGVNSLNAILDNYIFTHNILRGSDSGNWTGAEVGSVLSDNVFPALSTDIGYVDSTEKDFTLDETSDYYTSASDGGPIGCDVSAVLAAVAGVRDAAANYPPVLTIQAGLGFVEGDGATALDAASTITDQDGTTLVSGAIVGGGIVDGADEVLVIGGTSYPLNANKTATGTGGGTTFSIAYTTATQTFAITKSGGGTFPRADYQTLMRGITYDNAASPVTEGDRTFDFTVNDGIDDSNTDRITVTVSQPVGTTWPDDWDGYDTPSALLAPAGTLADFTYLISLDQMSATWWATVKSDGGDIRASKSDGTTQLAVDLIEWTYGSQTGLLAVKYSGNQTATPDDILIWCGNVSASQPAASDTYGSDNAYASSRLAFYASGGGNDRTSNNNDLTMTGSPSVGGAAGPIDGSTATDYDGSTQYGIANANVPTAAPLTLLGCFNSDSAATLQAIVCAVQAAGTSDNNFRLAAAGATASDPVSFRTRSNGNGEALSSTGYTASAWYHAAGIERTNADRDALIDGGSTGNNTTARTPTSIDRITVGAMANAAPGNFFNGRLSFVSIHNVALSADWIAYEAAMLDGADPDQSDFFGTWNWTAS